MAFYPVSGQIQALASGVPQNQRFKSEIQVLQFQHLDREILRKASKQGLLTSDFARP